MEYGIHEANTMCPGNPVPVASGLCPASDVPAAQFSQSLETLIRERTSNRIRNLRVELGPQRVTLSGRCATYYGKQLATHAAMEVIGSALLVNIIEVAGEGET